MMQSKLRKSVVAIMAVIICLTVAAACVLGVSGLKTRGASAASSFGVIRYTSDYSSKQEAIEAGAALNERIAAEGAVLLKNENDALPLDPGGVGSGATRVTLFGYKSVKPEGGASINDTDASAGVTINTSDFYTSLAKEGYKTNPVVKAAYSDWISADTKTHTSDFAAVDEKDPTGIKKFTDDVAYSFADYGDAAIVVLSGTGATSTNGGRTLDAKAAWDGDNLSHSRQIDKVQKALLDKVVSLKDAGVFKSVIVLINDSTPMELGYINEKADAVMLIGNPGASGFNAVGGLLSGRINPSGRLADTYAAKFEVDPTFYNIGRNGVEPVAATETSKAYANGNQYVDEKGNALKAFYVDYEEGIYVGYRFYETMAAELNKNSAGTGDTWYNTNVVYPFGYGLSYSDFKWEVVSSEVNFDDADDDIEVLVKVTNNGELPGREVVQLYYSAPYTGKIEKSSVVLGDFAKTDILAKGESQTLKLTLKARDMASYDATRSHDGKTGGYVLEAGEYKLTLQTSAHHTVAEIPAMTNTLGADIVVGKSDQTGAVISNAFDDQLKGLGAQDTRATHAGAKGFTELSRKDMVNYDSKQPVRRSLYDYEDAGKSLAAPVKRASGLATANNVLNTSKGEFNDWNVNIDYTKDSNNNGIIDYDEGKPWAVAKADAPVFADAATRPEKAAVMLSDLIGKSYNDPMWDTLLNQITLDEAIAMIEFGGFKSNAIPYIGKPETLDTDSPLGWSGNGTAGATLTKFATAPVIACTFSKEIAYEMGKMMGDQGLWGRSDTGTAVKAYTGWYGPGMNTHRSPFLSRYTEYYSEDGYLAGMLAANASLGAAEKGCYVFIKHFAAHEDGSTDRGIFTGQPGSATSGLSVWVSEQALREIILKPFMISVEVGEASAAMSSFSRIGSVWAGGSYGLLTQVLRNEWGFDGMVNTDIAIYDFVSVEQAIRAGGDMILDASVYGFPAPACTVVVKNTNNATQLAAIRKTAKNILFTVANSNAMQLPIGAAVAYDASELEDATVGAEYTANVANAAFNTVNDYGVTIEYAVTGGELPAGVTFDGGVLSGTPKAAGQYTFTVTATAAGFAPDTATFVLTVNADKSGEDAMNGAITDVGNKVDNATGELNGKIEANNTAISDMGGAVTVAIVFSVIAALAAIAAVVVVIVKK